MPDLLYVLPYLIPLALLLIATALILILRRAVALQESRQRKEPLASAPVPFDVDGYTLLPDELSFFHVLRTATDCFIAPRPEHRLPPLPLSEDHSYALCKAHAQYKQHAWIVRATPLPCHFLSPAFSVARFATNASALLPVGYESTPADHPLRRQAPALSKKQIKATPQ